MADTQDLVFEKALINPTQLHEELRAALGDVFTGVSTGNGQVRIHLREKLTQAAAAQVETILVAHDPTKLTAAQQAEAERQAQLDSLRKPWAEWTPEDQESFLQVLAGQAGLLSLK